MRVLILKFGALGDIILDSPIINAILTEHKNQSVSLLTSTVFKELFQDFPDLSVKTLNRRNLFSNIKAIRWVRSQKFDRIYDLQSNDRSRIFCILSGASEIVGNHSRFPYTHHPGDVYSGQNHIFERHNQLLESVNIAKAPPRPILPVSSRHSNSVNEWLVKHDLKNRKLVLIHAGTSPKHLQKRWPYFLELATKINAAGYEIIWLGHDPEASLNSAFSRSCGLDATKEFNVSEIVSLGRLSEFALTNDSGPMHILSCSEIPVYSFFGPTNWRRNHALGQKNKVISLGKSNELWSENDFSAEQKNDLKFLTFPMAWSFLSREIETDQQTLE